MYAYGRVGHVVTHSSHSSLLRRGNGARAYKAEVVGEGQGGEDGKLGRRWKGETPTHLR